MTKKQLKRKLWKILESYGCLQKMKHPFMKEVRDDLFGELVELYERSKEK